MWGLLAPLLAVAGGTYLAIQSNKTAANTVNQAVANAQSAYNTEAQSGGTGPGASYLRTLVASPQTLTPAQQSQLQDLRRSTANELHGSDFAGSGRTAAALFKKSEDDFTNSALQQNQQNAIGAADKLAGTSSTAENAAIQAGLTGAETNANADIATGKIYGQALGDVSSLINRQSKLQQVNGSSDPNGYNIGS